MINENFGNPMMLNNLQNYKLVGPRVYKKPARNILSPVLKRPEPYSNTLATNLAKINGVSSAKFEPQKTPDGL